ncbi:unnamed protein product, partial [Candidula unifasciata]
SGCADGTREGLHGFESAAACEGVWDGHISNAGRLCSPGWRVCTSFDVDLLRNITWKHALSVHGCMAINAAQDGGRCRECRGGLEQDDMAGVGQSCPHQSEGQTSCISGGRMDASCCVDSHFHTACHFKPGLINGVVCCRLPAKRPHIVVKPPERLQVYRDFIFLLTCQASGMPPPRVHWYRDGRKVTSETYRISVLSSGDLLVTLAKRSDTGLYTCEAINEHGIDMASSYVSITEHSSGCADGTTDGLHMYPDIQACSGAWKGHVKYGKSLCAKGWRVCNPRNRKSIKKITLFDTTDLVGCYAYNAAARRNKCKRCQSSKMAGVGKDCGWVSYSHKSCLSFGRVDVFSSNETSSCEYTEGLTTGVLCCKKPKQVKETSHECKPGCENRGVCLPHNRCKCAKGYKGARCQIPICEQECGSKGVCIQPNTCRCQEGYSGDTCRQKVVHCQPACLNGGQCHKGKCKCSSSFWGKLCQYPMQHVLLSKMNRTER